MNRSFWNCERDVELAKRYVGGEAVEDIAAAFGCSSQSVKTRCSTLGVVRRKVRRDRPENGNAGFLIGNVRRGAIPIDPNTFSDDLLGKLDQVPRSRK